MPLHRERFDLLIRRREFFQPSFQRLMSFTRSGDFKTRAEQLGGYDIAGLGTVRFNAP